MLTMYAETYGNYGTSFSPLATLSALLMLDANTTAKSQDSSAWLESRSGYATLGFPKLIRPALDEFHR
jgi:hypothetical protein